MQLIVDGVSSNASPDIPVLIAKEQTTTENRHEKKHDPVISIGGTDRKQFIPENCVRIDMSSSHNIAKVGAIQFEIVCLCHAYAVVTHLYLNAFITTLCGSRVLKTCGKFGKKTYYIL